MRPLSSPFRRSADGAQTSAVAAALLVAVLALTGCAASSHGSNTSTMNGGGGNGMMNGGNGNSMFASGGTDAQSSYGGGMMSGGYSYNASAATCTSTPASLPGSTVTVILTDMGMTQMMGGDAPMGARMQLSESIKTVASGKVSFLADNRGWRTHELVILPLQGTAQAGQLKSGADGKVSETGALTEASAKCGAGKGSGIPAGSASWVTVTLPAGRYELVCNLKNHYADGMHDELTVT